MFGAAVDLTIVSRTWTPSTLQKSEVGYSVSSVVFVYVVLGLGGYLFGTMVAYLSGRQLDYTIVIGLETGSRTTYVVSGLIAASFAQPEADISLGPPAFCAALSVISAAAVGAVYRTVRNCRVNFRYAEAACKLLPVIDSGADDVEELCLQPQLVVA
jgi:predicted Na+-dependent transporter